MGDAAMTRFLGGPETAEQLEARHEKYSGLAAAGKGHMFQVRITGFDEPVGSVGFWGKRWRDADVYEMGWHVIPAAQGRGVARAATALALGQARSEHKHRYVHAFPSVENAASNALCESLGFSFLGEHDFEFPPGNLMRCNDWVFDLDAASPDG